VNARDADRAPAPACHDGVCITCSDTAVEVTVVELLDLGFAVVIPARARKK
jgi:hypothetical protein